MVTLVRTQKALDITDEGVNGEGKAREKKGSIFGLLLEQQSADLYDVFLKIREKRWIIRNRKNSPILMHAYLYHLNSFTINSLFTVF